MNLKNRSDLTKSIKTIISSADTPLSYSIHKGLSKQAIKELAGVNTPKNDAVIIFRYVGLDGGDWANNEKTFRKATINLKIYTYKGANLESLDDSMIDAFESNGWNDGGLLDDNVDRDTNLAYTVRQFNLIGGN